ncbi:MAG: alpha/beta hydrolase [Pseudomonadota bacterium]
MTGLTFRDRAVAATARYALRPMMTLPLPWQMHRAGLDLLTLRPLARPGVTETSGTRAGVPVLTISPEAPTGTLLWLHGGGFVMGSPESYRVLADALARTAGLRVVLPDYRKAPEHAFPAGLDDCLAVTRTVAAEGPYHLGGDSAGGNLALAVCAEMLEAGSGPARMALVSPVGDLDPGRALPRDSDEMLLSTSTLRRMAEDYLGGADPADPRASPVRAAFPDPPPTLIQAVDGEILEGDADAIARRLRAFGGRVAVEKVPGMPHDYQLFVGLAPAADAAVARMAAFLRGDA